MREKKYIVTVINSITDTSMPYNEFVLYRHKNFFCDKQTVIVCNDSIPDAIDLPDDLDVHCVAHSGKKIRSIMKQVESVCNKEKLKLIVHLHQPKSATIFNLSTIFHDYRNITVFTVHSLFDAYSVKNKFLSIVSSLLASRVSCVSNASYDHYPKFVKKFKKKNILVIKNGVDLRRIESATTSETDLSNDVKTFIYVARMIPIKNHKFLIDVFSQLERCKLVLIGAEDKNGEIRSLIEKKQLGNTVELLGLIPRNEVFKRLKQADVYISPSLIEGMPVSVLEAMYVGLPVVVSDIEPHLEIGIHDKNIVTLELETIKWIETLNRYINMDEKLLKQMGNDSKKCAERYFSLDKMLENYDELYENI